MRIFVSEFTTLLFASVLFIKFVYSMNFLRCIFNENVVYVLLISIDISSSIYHQSKVKCLMATRGLRRSKKRERE